MPPLPLNPNVYQVTTFGTLHGKPCDHVINWFIVAGTGGPANVANILAAGDASHWMSAYADRMNVAYTHLSSRCVYQGDLSVPQINHAAGVVGTQTGTHCPSSTCSTIRHKSPIRGKGLDGRTNLPPPLADDLLPGDEFTLGATLQSELTARFATYVAAMQADVAAGSVGSSIALVCINRRKLGTHLIPTSSECDATLNTHRRWAKRLARH